MGEGKDSVPLLVPKARIGHCPSSGHLQGEQRVVVGFCAVGEQAASPGGVPLRGLLSQWGDGCVGAYWDDTVIPLAAAGVIGQNGGCRARHITGVQVLESDCLCSKSSPPAAGSVPEQSSLPLSYRIG